MFQGQCVFQGQHLVETQWSLKVPHTLVVTSLCSASADLNTAADKVHLVVTMWWQHNRAQLSAVHNTPVRELICYQLLSANQSDEHSFELVCDAFPAENITTLQASSHASG